MDLRIVTWNMNHWQEIRRDPGHTRAAWDYLKKLKPDLALVQEATSPLANGAVSDWEGRAIPIEPISWHIGPTRPWGSAVVSYGPKLTEVSTARSPYSWQNVPLYGTHPGCVRVAQADLPDGSKLTLISVYGLIDAGYAVTTMHRILSDLTPLFDDWRYNNGRKNIHVVLAGDLNVGTQWREGNPHLARHRLVLERIKAFGLVDCLDLKLRDTRPLVNCPCGAPACRHIRTQRYARKPERPYQNDYIFASERLAAKLIACCAHNGDDDPAWEHSDHCPVVADFAL